MCARDGGPCRGVRARGVCGARGSRRRAGACRATARSATIRRATIRRAIAGRRTTAGERTTAEPTPARGRAALTHPSSPAATELDGPAPRTTAGTGGSTQSGSTQSGLAGCAVWTDRCVICQRDSGVVACSNIGIACQPQPMVCLRPEAAPEKKPEH